MPADLTLPTGNAALHSTVNTQDPLGRIPLGRISVVDIVTLLSSDCLCHLRAQRLGNHDTAVWGTQKQSTFESLTPKAESLTLQNLLCLCWHFPTHHLVSAHMSSLKFLMLPEDEMKNMRKRSITAILNIKHGGPGSQEKHCVRRL